MSRLFKYVLMFAFVAIALFALNETSDNAEAANVTWKQSIDNLASNNNNWENGTAPTTGDDVYFTSLSTAACTWDITATVNYISIGSGYTGAGAIITFASNINIASRGYYQAGGTVTSTTAYILTTSGPFTVINTPAITANVLKLVMTGASKSITSSITLNLYSLTVNGDTTTASIVRPYVLTINSGKILTINGAFQLRTDGAEFGIFNNGSVVGTGSILIPHGLYNRTASFGTVLCNMVLSGSSEGSKNFNIKLTGNSILGNVTVQSLDAVKTFTFNLDVYSITSRSLTILVRGIVIGSGSISCSSNFDSYNGTTSGSWSLTMTGTNPWIKTPAANTINGLTWTGTNLRLVSSVNVTKTFWVGGTYTLGTKTLTVGTGTNVTITLGNTWTVPSTRYWGKLNVAGTLIAVSPVSVWANGTSYINGTVNSNIILHTRAMKSFNGVVGDLYLETGSMVHFYANGTWSNIYWNITTTWYFHPETLMPFTSPVYSKAQMRVIDPTNNAYYIEVTRFDTNAGFYITVHGWAAETWEFVVRSTYATATLFTYNIVTPDVETEPVLIYLNGVYLDAKNMTLGSFTMNDVFNASMGSRDYLIVCSDFGPGAIDTSTDMDSVGIALFFLVFITIINLIGFLKGIGLLQLTSFMLLIIGMWISTDLITNYAIIPLSFAIINGILFIMGILKGR
jgi:hypothetical protein